ERGLIKCTGRKEIVGRPMLFGTSDEFLKVFNLSSIKDLPPLEAFQPSREVVQGGPTRMAEGSDDLVDIEQYIADNAGGEDEGAAEILDEDRGSKVEDDHDRVDFSAESSESDDEAALLEHVANELHGTDESVIESERPFGATKSS